MKMPPPMLAELHNGTAQLDTPARREAARAAGWSDMRYRWSLLWAGTSQDFRRRMYDPAEDGGADLNDNHIDTALRKCVPNLNG